MNIVFICAFNLLMRVGDPTMKKLALSFELAKVKPFPL